MDAFELWCWRRLLRVPWTTRRSNQSVLEEISPGCSLEGLMLMLIQYFGHLMRRANSLEEILMLGKTEGRRGRGRQRMRCLDGIADSMDLNLESSYLGDRKGQGGLACCSPWGHKELDTTWCLNNSTNATFGEGEVMAFHWGYCILTGKRSATSNSSVISVSSNNLRSMVDTFKIIFSRIFMFEGIPGGSGGKLSACNAGDQGSIPGSGRSPGEGNGNPLQYSYLENSMGTWQATVHGITKIQPRLSD